MVREVITEWVGPQGGGMRSIMFYDEAAGTAAEARAGVAELWDALEGNFTDEYTWAVLPETRILSTASGQLTGVETDATVHTGSGSATGQPAADATQALLRWSTGEIVNGRRLNGRTFLPGTPVANLADGNLAGFAQTGINGVLATWLALGGGGIGFHVWHRPVNGAGGLSQAVVAGTVWAELDVLRRRRG